MQLDDYIYLKCSQYSSVVRQLGHAEAGINGPYSHSDTPVRNTAHWLIAFSWAAEKYNDDRMRDSAKTCLDYLMSEQARPMGASFHCRSTPEKDFCNGLIGQAWCIEALCYAAEKLKRDDARDLALSVYRMHPFVDGKSIWRRLACDGSLLSVDSTFNHQLWFAAASAQIKDSEVDGQISRFIDNAILHLDTYYDGVIYHASKLGSVIARNLSSAELAKSVYDVFWRARSRKRLYSKSVGYHCFNLYAFAMLKQSFPNDAVWKSRIIHRLTQAISTEKFRSSLRKSEYGWPYNPPGLEAAYFLEQFTGNELEAEYWVHQHCSITYDINSEDLLTKLANDKVTVSARIYEAVRLRGQYQIQKSKRAGLGR